ncbi:MAG: 50S ribosome-binding GTPase [Prevotella sp.]|nr:50S ribosome-binding GTPase [Prevotella sp.]
MERVNKINVGILGEFQNGKSTFVNCLLDDMVAKTGGYGLSVTSTSTMYEYGSVQNVSYLSKGSKIANSRLVDFLATDSYPSKTDKVMVSLWKPILNNINIIDTPGFNANEEDTAMATSSLLEIDIAVLVMENKDISTTEIKILSLLKQHHIPFFVIMNCKDHMGNSWTPNSEFNNRIAKKNIARIHSQGLTPIPINKEEIWQTNLLWFWFASEQYLSENEDKRQKYIKKINYYYSEMNNNANKSIKEFCLTGSNFLQLRDYFVEDSLWNNFPLTMTRWRKVMDSVLIDWENKIT